MQLAALRKQHQVVGHVAYGRVAEPKRVLGVVNFLQQAQIPEFGEVAPQQMSIVRYGVDGVQQRTGKTFTNDAGNLERQLDGCWQTIQTLHDQCFEAVRQCVGCAVCAAYACGAVSYFQATLTR